MKRLGILLALSVTWSAAEKNAQWEFGGSLGWGGPFGGLSLEGAYFPAAQHGVRLGAGLSGSGLRYGLGYEFYINPENTFVPCLGIATSYAGGIKELTVNVNTDTALYQVNGATLLSPRLGLRYQGESIGLEAHAGYGLAVTGGGVEYLSGDRNQSIEDVAEMVGAGGMEISASLFIKLGS